MYNPWGEQMHQWTASTYAFSSPYRFNGKELDPETGLAYYGARYYQNKLSLWLSVDPLATEYPNVTPYSFSNNNPIALVDPDGQWLPGVDENGNVTYTAENGDNFKTLIKQYNLSEETAKKILNPNSVVIAGVTTINGNRVMEITGNKILKLDLKQSTNDQRNHQIAFALTVSITDNKYSFNLGSFFLGIDHESDRTASGFQYGFGTDPNKPTLVTINGKKELIAFNAMNWGNNEVETYGDERNPCDWKVARDHRTPRGYADRRAPGLTIYYYLQNWKEIKK